MNQVKKKARRKQEIPKNEAKRGASAREARSPPRARELIADTSRPSERLTADARRRTDGDDRNHMALSRLTSLGLPRLTLRASSPSYFLLVCRLLFTVFEGHGFVMICGGGGYGCIYIFFQIFLSLVILFRIF